MVEKRKYNKFKAQDFILDDDFQSWVNTNDPKQEEFWAGWVAAHPKRAGEISKAKDILLALNFKEEAVAQDTIDNEWARLQSSQSSKHIGTPKTNRYKPSYISWSLKIAATLLILVASFYAIRESSKTEPQNHEIAIISKTVAEGQKLTLTLADGTNIKLNAGSSISYPEVFSGKIREVVLTGEAFFKVTPNPDAPFIVRTGNISTTVLGTSFNINAYPEKDQVQIALVEGKVRVNSYDPKKKIEAEVFLTPDEVATAQKDASEILVTPFDPSEVLAWKEGILYFGQVDFKEVVNHLERWYGVSIEIDPNKKIEPEWRFSGKFENKSLEYVLGVFSYPERFSFRIEGRKVFIN